MTVAERIACIKAQCDADCARLRNQAQIEIIGLYLDSGLPADFDDAEMVFTQRMEKALA